MSAPTRRRACLRCNFKKRRCDQQRPSCGACASRDLLCTYCERPWTFVPYSFPAGFRLSTRLLNDQALLNGITDAFWDCYLPHDPPRNHDGAACFDGTRGLRDLATIVVTDQTAQQALQACALVCVGRLHHDRELLEYGTRAYGHTLVKINAKIASPLQRDSDGMLAICAIASVFENFRPDYSKVPSQADGWLAHVDGVCRLIELRGPAKHTTGSSHVLFRGVRLLAVRSSIMWRTPHLFSRPTWLTVPWSVSTRNLQDQLFDHMLQLPALLERRDTFSSALMNTDEHSRPILMAHVGRQLVNDCLDFAHTLRRWASTASAMCNEGGKSLFDIPTDEMAALVARASYDVFLAANLYWATCLIHYSHLEFTFALLSRYIDLPALPNWLQSGPYADAIIESALHFFTPQAGLWGLQHSALPIGTTMYYLAVSGGEDCSEMHMLKALYADNERGQLVYPWIKSMAATTKAINRGRDMDFGSVCCNMASKWYGVVERGGAGSVSAS